MEQPTSEEKVLAALAHASGIFLFLGPVGSLIVWLIQRNKSKYVRYHALQAMGYQVFSFWAWMVSLFIFTSVYLGVSVIFAVLTSESSTLPLEGAIIFQFIFFLIVFGMLGLMFLLGFAGAVFCILGKDFRYPFIGAWLQKKFLDEENEELAEKWEDYWVGGICHATAILQMWGMVTPAIVWLSQKDRSPILKFQSLQAFLYQLIATIVYIISNALFFFFYILFIATLAMSGIAADPNHAASPEFGMALTLIMVLFAIFWGASTILYPVYIILAGIGSVRTLRGHDFKYPLLGGIISRRMKDRGESEAASIKTT